MPSSALAPGILLGLSLYAVLDILVLASSSFLTGGSTPTGTILLIVPGAAAIFAASWLSRSPSLASAEARTLTLSRPGVIVIATSIVLLLLGGSLLVTKYEVSFGIMAFPIAAAATSVTLFAMWRVPRFRMLTAAALLAIGVQLTVSSVSYVGWASSNNIDLLDADLLYLASAVAYVVGAALVFVRARSGLARAA
jgi:hypothetical protein